MIGLTDISPGNALQISINGFAPAHSAHVIKGFLAKNNKALVQQPPYSPDLAP